MNNKQFNPIKEFDPEWIKKEIDSKCITYLENFGLFLCDKKQERDRLGYNAVTTSQLRNIFSEVKRIEAKIENDEDEWKQQQSNILFLRPKIAYNTARVLTSKRNSRMAQFRKVIEKALLEVEPNDKETFKRFSQFFEGIIAYHKVYGAA